MYTTVRMPTDSIVSYKIIKQRVHRYSARNKARNNVPNLVTKYKESLKNIGNKQENADVNCTSTYEYN